jgi:hypothetical protein
LALANPIVSINGTPRQLARFSVSSAQDNQDRMTGVLYSASSMNAPAGTIKPTIDDVVTVLDEAGDLLYGGSIKRPTLKAIGDALSSVATQTAFSCLDFNELVTRAQITITIPAGTLKAALTALLAVINANLPAALQITLDAAQVDGPALDELVYRDVYGSEIFADLSVRTGYLRNVSYARVLTFFSVGSRVAPWNIADGDGNRYGDMEVSKDRVDYFNRIKVKFWAAGVSAYAFFDLSGTINDGEQVVVGGRTYTFQTVLTDVSGNVEIGTDPIGNLNAAINLAGGGHYAASTTRNDAVSSYVFAADALKVSAVSVGATGNSIACTTTCAQADWIWEGGIPTITLAGGIDAGLNNETVRNNTGEQSTQGVYSSIVEALNVYTYDDANTLGDALVAIAIIVQETITYFTRKAGLLPGMTQTIQCAKRSINSSCIITALDTTWIEGNILERTVTAVTGAVYKGSKWRDQYKKWSGAGTSASSFSGSVTISTGGSGGRSVYFLGGVPEVWVRSATPTWVPVHGTSTGTSGDRGGIEYVIDTAVRGSNTGTVFARLRAKSGSVTARLWDIDTGVSVGSSIPITSTVFVNVSFPVALTTGSKRYRLELLPSVPNVDVNGVAYFE